MDRRNDLSHLDLPVRSDPDYQGQQQQGAQRFGPEKVARRRGGAAQQSGGDECRSKNRGTLPGEFAQKRNLCHWSDSFGSSMWSITSTGTEPRSLVNFKPSCCCSAVKMDAPEGAWEASGEGVCSGVQVSSTSKTPERPVLSTVKRP